MDDETTIADPAAGAVRAMFSRLAPRYDLGNHLFSAGLDHRWRSRAAALCDPRPGETVLDLCCGTGDLALALVRRRPGIRVVAADFSAPMLALAGRKLRRARLPATARPQAGPGRRAVTLLAADALRVPLADGAVDAVVCGFGLRNLADPLRGLAEMVRVVRPGGRVVVLEFHQPTGRGPAAALFRLYFHRILPRLGRWLSGGRAYAYLVASIQAFGPRGETAERMRRAGLEAVRVVPLPGGVAAAYVGRRAPAPAADGRDQPPLPGCSGRIRQGRESPE